MRNILIFIFCSIAIVGGMISYAQTNPQQDVDVASKDSTIDVVGYFSKNDTLIYWINQSQWRLSPSDTVKTAGVSTKVRLTVVDSTSTGYKMDYTFLEVRVDSVADSSRENFQNTIIGNLGKKIVGTTIHFETDEFGAITKFNNLAKIKRQAKSLFRGVMNELFQIPEIAVLKNELNIDIKAIEKCIDTDKLIDVYLENLKLLFLYHGNAYNIGQTYIHEDATATAYENDTYFTVELDSSDYTYSISTTVINIIPQSELRELVGDIVELMDNDSITRSFDKEFDASVTEDALYDSYFSTDFLSSGWPYKVVKQSTTTIGNRGKSDQTYIYLDYINY